MTDVPQFPRDRIREEIDRLFQEQRDNAERERIAAEKRRKAFSDGLAIGIALLAATFTGWQAWEAHETRKEAAQLSVESLHYGQRAYIGAEGLMTKAHQATVVFKAFGNSPAVNILYRYQCWLSTELNPTEPEAPGGGSSSIELPEGSMLLPGSSISQSCLSLSKEKNSTRQFSYLFFKGDIIYKDIFRVPHSTKFCFYEHPDNANVPMEQCETGNSAN